MAKGQSDGAQRTTPPYPTRRVVPWACPLLLALALGMRFLAPALPVPGSAGGSAATKDALRWSPALLPLAPPSLDWLKVQALGDPALAARIHALWLSTWPANTLPESRLLAAWLTRTLALAPDSLLPLVIAARVHAAGADPAHRQPLIDFLRQAFATAPTTRWPYLAETALLAAHRGHAPTLAMSLAADLRTALPRAHRPAWVRQMEVFLRAQAGERDVALALFDQLVAEDPAADPEGSAYLRTRITDTDE